MSSVEIMSSISYNQHDIIRWVIELHLDGKPIECDPTFGAGVFYKPEDIEIPKLISDIAPNPKARLAIERCDCRELPYPSETIASIMFDPPFLERRSDDDNIGQMRSRYGYYPSMAELWEFYKASLQEFHRLLMPKGHLLFKCQDTVRDHKNYMSHVAVMNMAYRIGFYPKDIFIVLVKHRMPQWNLKRQYHARKFHSYFWVFQKTKPRVVYKSCYSIN